jgi:DNA-binding CsgD family transcriptional regulator
MAHKKPYCPLNRSDTRHGLVYREPTHQWRVFSRAARAIVTVLVEPRGAAHDTELKLLNRAGDPDANHAIERWLRGCELKVRFRNRPTRLTLYGAPPLWTAIGLELAALAAGASGIILCSNCGRLDSVKRPRRVDDQRRAFCARCRDKGRKRLGAADLRQREREARTLHAEHKSVKEIAAQLGIDTARVRGYLEKEKNNA